MSENISAKTVGVLLDATLRELREIFHRQGSLGQHEVLDEVSKLLFAHIVDIDSGGYGISKKRLAGLGNPATELKLFVEKTFREHLPASLSSEIGLNEYRLLLKSSENVLALDIVDCFESLSSPIAMKEIKSAKSIDLLNDVFGKFLSDSFVDEKEMGQYLTPKEVIKYMVQLGLHSLSTEDRAAFIKPNIKADDGIIMDPSCGVGSILVEVMHVLHAEVKKKHSEADTKKWIETFLDDNLIGIDKSSRMIKLATTNLGMYGAPTVYLHSANSLARSGRDGVIADGLQGKVKLIITNPPFGAEIRGNDLKKYHIASDWSDKELRTVTSEILFLERYIDWLAPGGTLVTVVPDSILTNKGIFGRLRKALAPLVELLSVTSLPRAAFAAAGTNTKTSILHLKKRAQPSSTLSEVKFAVCDSLGFEVATRGSQRVKVYKGGNDLEEILPLMLGTGSSNRVSTSPIDIAIDRWDASFHGYPIEGLDSKLTLLESEGVKVREVASLSKDKQNPKKLDAEFFKYIEISDVVPGALYPSFKNVATQEAPGRARKLVRAGDVLVSTVRPERKSIAIVPSHLEGAICSTGFAVLRCEGVQPLVLAKLLATDFANVQILKHNSGIAYPVVDENCLLNVVLPARKEDISNLEARAIVVESAAASLMKATEALEKALKFSVSTLFKLQSKSQTSSNVENQLPLPMSHNGF